MPRTRNSSTLNFLSFDKSFKSRISNGQTLAADWFVFLCFILSPTDPLIADHGPGKLPSCDSRLCGKSQRQFVVFQQANGCGGHSFVVVATDHQARFFMSDNERNTAGIRSNYWQARRHAFSYRAWH